MKYVVWLVVIFIFISCKQKNAALESKTDILLTELHLYQDSVLQMDTDLIINLSNEVKDNLKKIHSFSDTLDAKSALIIAESYQAKSKLFYFQDNHKRFNNELDTCKQQLEKLKLDLNNGLITKDDFDKYYLIEKEVFLNLKQTINQSYADALETSSWIKENSSQMDSILLYLKNKKGDF